MIEVIKRSNKILKTLEINYNSDVKDHDAYSFADSIGNLPFIVINGVTIEPKDIIFFKLYNDKYLPELDMTFNDPTNKLFDDNYPLDQQIVSIMIKPNESLLMPIRMDFWIYQFNSIKNKSNSDFKKYEIKAKLNIPYIIKQSNFKGTSYDALMKISEESELGFATNIDNTNDTMNWINCGIDYVREQIPEIVKRSYINDNTFTWAYIDFWYNLNYIDVEKQLNLDTLNDTSLSGNELLTGKNDIIPLVLSNHPDYSYTNQFFNKFNLINNSTEVNYNISYNPHIYYYDMKNKNINDIIIDTISNKGNKDNKIILKGQPDDPNYNLNQRKNYFLGKIDTDNVHENYLYAEKLNKNNLDFLQKIRMNIILDKINFQLYRFQVVNLKIYKLSELDSGVTTIKINKDEISKNTDKYKLNNRLSGDWIILGINYTYIRKGNNDKLMQEIILARRELSS